MPQQKLKMPPMTPLFAGIALATFAFCCAVTPVEAQIYDYGMHAPTVPGCPAGTTWTKVAAYYKCQAPALPDPPDPPVAPPATPTPFAVCAAAVAARGYALRSSPWSISAHPRNITYWAGVADGPRNSDGGTLYDVGCQVLDGAGTVSGLQIFEHCPTCGGDGGG